MSPQFKAGSVYYPKQFREHLAREAKRGHWPPDDLAPRPRPHWLDWTVIPVLLAGAFVLGAPREVRLGYGVGVASMAAWIGIRAWWRS